MNQKKNELSAAKKSELPDEMSEIIDALPAENRETVRQLLVSQVSMMARVSPDMEIAKKVTSEHITDVLKTQDKGMTYTYKEHQHKMIFTGIVFALAIGTVFGLIAILQSTPDIMEKVLIGFLGFAAGALGGYGYRSSKKDDD